MKFNRLQAAGLCLAVSMGFSGFSSAQGAGPLTTRELVEMSELSSLSVSPDGAYAAVRVDQQRIATNRIGMAWYVVAIRTGQPVRVADAGGPLFVYGGSLASQTAQWSGDSRWIYYLAEEGQQLQVWRARRDGAVVEQLTHDAADVENFTVDRAGNQLHYAVRVARAAVLEAERLEYERGIEMNDSVLYGFPLTRSFPINGRMGTYRLVTPPDSKSWPSTLLGDTALTAYTLDLSTHQVTAAGPGVMERITEAKTSAGISSSDGRRVAVLQSTSAVSKDIAQRYRGREALGWRRSQDGAIAAVCLHEVCTDADRLAVLGWGPGDREVIFLADNFGVQGLYGWDVGRNSVRRIFADEGTYGASLSGYSACPLAGREAICIASAADIPPRLVAIDLKTGKRRTLLDPNPELTPQRLGKAETIALSDRSGGRAYARLVLPRQRKAGEKLPLVITSYSCPGFLSGAGSGDVPEHILAQRGFAALCVEASWKHRRPSLATTREADIIPSFEVFENAIDVLDRRGLIDTTRVAVTGLSHSSSVTTYAISRSQRFTTAIITARGFLDPMDYYFANFRPGVKRPPDPFKDPAWWHLSPALNADAIEAPLLMQLPENEYLCMMQLFSTLKNQDKGVEMIVYPDEDHIKRQPIHHQAVYESNVAWLEFWLKGMEPHEPWLAARSAHWRVMREQQCGRMKGEKAPWYCRDFHADMQR